MAIDRITFVQNMESNKSLQDLFKELFDEIMALYDMIGEYDCIVTHSESSQVVFTLTFNTVEDAGQIYNCLNHRTVAKYGREFKCLAEHNDNILIVYIQE